MTNKMNGEAKMMLQLPEDFMLLMIFTAYHPLTVPCKICHNP